MKNFFKKLSFVLAIAMVLTSLAPATASAAAKNYVAVNGKKATATYAYIGGKEVVLTPYVNGKKATKVTIENSNPEKATIDNNGVITPVANGNTIVTFKKGDKKIGTVTVKVRTRAKALNIYDRAEYKAGKKEKLSEVTLKVGDKKDLQITMPLYKVSKKAGAVKASYFTYAEVDGTAVKVTKNAGQRNFTVEAVEAGTAKVTIVANQKTEKNVRADKYYKEASFDVTVEEEAKFTAEQTNYNEITVKGVSGTAVTVKKGNVPMAIEVKVKDGVATVLSSASKFQAGTYTVSDGTNTVEVEVVEEKLTDIKFASENLVRTAAVATTATVGFEALNQWEKDMTSRVATFNANSSFGVAPVDTTNKVISVPNIPATVLDGTKVTVIVVDTATGVNKSAELVLSPKAQATSYEILDGVYTAKGVKTDLQAGVANADAYVLVAVKDQYGNAVLAIGAETSVNFSPVMTNLGLQATSDKVITVDGAKYVGLKVTAGVDTVAGEAQLLIVSKANGNNASAKVVVGRAKVVTSFTASPKKDVLVGATNTEFTFSASNEAGEAITDYATLAGSNGVDLTGTGFTWGKQDDGKTAKLVFTPNPTDVVPAGLTSVKLYKSVKLGSGTLIKYEQVVFDLYAGSVPTSLSKPSLNGVLVNKETADLLDVLKVYDQYGNAITNIGAYTIDVDTADTTGIWTVSKTAITGDLTAADCTFVSHTTAGAVTFKIALKNGSDVVSETNVKLVSANLADLSNFKLVPSATTFEVKGLKADSTDPTGYSADANYVTWGQAYAFTITGTTTDGDVVDVPFDSTTVSAKSDSVSATGVFDKNDAVLALKVAKAGKDIVETFTATLDNKNGDVLTADVTLTNASSKVASAAFKTSAAKTLTTASAISGQLGAQIEVKDQYGKKKDVAASDITKIMVTDLATTSTIEKNNTVDAHITGTSGDDVVTVEITFKSGLVSTFAFTAH